jgi:hypothetical protein
MDEEEVTEEEVVETEEESSEEAPAGGGLLGGLMGALGGGGALGGLAEQVGDQLKSGSLNVGQLIDDATENQGGVIKAAGDVIGGFLNRPKSDESGEE